MRYLQGGGHGHGAEDLGSGHESGHTDNHSEHTIDLRIAAVFIIFVGSLIGSLPPLFSKRLRTPSTIVSGMLRAFAGGVILALAVVHIIPHSIAEFEQLSTYPIHGVLIVGGIFIMVVTENGLHALYHHDTSSLPEHDHHHGHSHAHTHVHTHDLEVEHVKDSHADPKHAHEPSHGTSNVTKITAWMMEIGCVFHSVIIGIELGVSEEKYSKVVGLIVALLFHQLIEGISLGSVISLAGFSFRKALTMILIYSMTTPVGITAGIGIAESYDPNSRTAHIVQGSLDGISGGLLVYIGLVHLVCPDFCSGARMSWKQRLSSFVALLAGAGCMCVLAIWA